MSDGDATHVVIYTDGACKGNPGIGGWGAFLQTGTGAAMREKELFGGVAETTNNRMEMTAVIEALAALTRRCKVTVYTDSAYVKNGMTEWLRGWKAKGWKTSARQPVKNEDLWRRLDALSAQHAIEWRWVKGHAGDPGNGALTHWPIAGWIRRGRFGGRQQVAQQWCPQTRGASRSSPFLFGKAWWERLPGLGGMRFLVVHYQIRHQAQPQE